MTGLPGRPGDPVSPAPVYAEPVDPWATAEAAGGVYAAPPGAWPPPAPERAGRPFRKWILWTAAVLVVLGLAATALVILWPRSRALDFTPLTDARHVDPAVPVTSDFSDAEIAGGRAYFASADDNGTLGVVAVDVATGKRLWGTTTAGTAKRWKSMVVLPSGLAAFTDTDYDTSTRRMAVLGAAHGDLLWDRTIDDQDDVFFVGNAAVFVDRTSRRLLGLDLATGRTRWEIPDLTSASGTATAVVPATTTDDLAGPAGFGGALLAPDPDDDQRIVQISADRSARVIDAGRGEIIRSPRPSVADPDDEVVAHNGRLFVRESGSAHRILAYDLGKLGEPTVLYTAAGATRRLSHLTPCGPDRICFVETEGFDAKTARVVSVDADSGGHWTRAVPNTDTLVPVGDAVLAQSSSPAAVTLLDAKGHPAWSAARAGEAARLNGGNMLLFGKALSTYPDDVFVWGDHVGDEVVPLGALAKVRSASCSWNTEMLACVGDRDFVLQRFAG